LTDEATVRDTDTGKVAEGEGWFILNLAEASWERDADLGTWCALEADDAHFSHFGIGPHLLMPGQASGRYHAETNRRASSSSPVSASRSSKARSATCASGTTCTARPGRTTSRSVPAMARA
jgi:hypothetical protein